MYQNIAPHPLNFRTCPKTGTVPYFKNLNFYLPFKNPSDGSTGGSFSLSISMKHTCHEKNTDFKNKFGAAPPDPAAARHQTLLQLARILSIINIMGSI